MCELDGVSPVVSMVVGCGPAVAVDGGESSTGEGDSTGTSTTIGPTTSPPTTGPAMTTSTVTTVGDVTTSDEDSSESGLGFIQNPDGGSCFTHCSYCDVWAQDCPDEEKCMPWANDGGDQWNATRCSLLDAAPAQPGEPCTAEGSAVTGLDDCDLASMCWDVDPDTNQGTCVPFCGGSEANPACDDEGTSCWIANEGVLILCLPTCDPLAPECGEGHSCVAADETFFCLPSERVEHMYDDPCEPSLGCGDGLVCAGVGATAECDATCCTSLCDLSAPSCPDADAGQTCVPYYEPGRAPAGAENLGVCLLDAE